MMSLLVVHIYSMNTHCIMNSVLKAYVCRCTNCGIKLVNRTHNYIVTRHWLHTFCFVCVSLFLSHSVFVISILFKPQFYSQHVSNWLSLSQNSFYPFIYHLHYTICIREWRVWVYSAVPSVRLCFDFPPLNTSASCEALAMGVKAIQYPLWHVALWHHWRWISIWL